MVVGLPYPQRSLVRDEGCGWHTNGVDHTILVCLRDLTDQELDQFQGVLSFALVPFGDVLVLLMQPEGQRWAEMPWAHLVDDEKPDARQYVAPAEGNRGHQVVKLIVVEQRTRVVKGLRAFTFSERFTSVMDEELRERINRDPIRGVDLFRKVMTLRERFRSPEEVLPFATARCHSGE